MPVKRAMRSLGLIGTIGVGYNQNGPGNQEFGMGSLDWCGLD